MKTGRRRSTLTSRFTRVRSRSLWLAAATALVAAAAFSGIAGASGNAQKVLTWGQQTDPGSLWNATDFNGLDGAPIMSLINQGLVSLTADSKLVPNLASSWKAVSPTKYVYTVRSGVKFSDGNTLTAKDVAYSMGVQKNPKTGSD